MQNRLGILKFKMDAFTSLSRTPWAGKEIARRYKSKLFSTDQLQSGVKIGESWEFSSDPSFVSRLEDGTSFLEWCAAFNSKDLFGLDSQLGEVRECTILVKLLNADQALSLQVHPTDEDKNLKEHECGKPESWLILHAEPGSGLYLGFKKELDTNTLRQSLIEGDAASHLLEFVPVRTGDYFEIDPGVPHAIGPGVTLLEPQRILPGKSGKTYRMWDWGRKYNAEGQVDLQNGTSRELHIEESLRLLDLRNQVGKKFVDSTRRLPKTLYGSSSKKSYIHIFPANLYYQLFFVSLEPMESIQIKSFNTEYAALISLDAMDGLLVGYAGTNKLLSRESKTFFSGESGFIPSVLFENISFRNLSKENKMEFALVLPATKRSKEFSFSE